MSLKYFCRHCGVMVGEVDEQKVHAQKLGFNHLNEQERMEMIQYDPNGDIRVKTICEDCQEALERNPELHQWDTFIQ